MEIGIIGSGISGLSLAKMLNKRHQVTVFERERNPGGLIKCERVNDCLFHKVGGHVFNSRNNKVLDWFWSHFDRDHEFVKASRNAKIYYNKKVIGYPIENYIYLLEKDIIKKITSELVELSKQPLVSPFEYDNFESFLKGNFGNTLYHLYFEPYNKKIWQVELSSVSMEWLEGKLPMPDFKEIVLSNIVREEDTTMVHSTFFYPKIGGSQFIVDRLSQDINIKTNVSVSDLVIGEKGILINELPFEKLVYCGDIRRLPKSLKQILSDTDIDVNYLESLRSNGTSNLFCETDANDISWLYIPENFTKAHRIIYTGNFSESNNKGSKRKTCVVEFSGEIDYETMVSEISKLPGNLQPLAYNYEPNSYVIQDKETRNVINAAKKVLESHGIFLLGRFAEWEYYNMDKAIEAAFVISEKIQGIESIN